MAVSIFGKKSPPRPIIFCKGKDGNWNSRFGAIHFSPEGMKLKLFMGDEKLSYDKPWEEILKFMVAKKSEIVIKEKSAKQK